MTRPSWFTRADGAPHLPGGALKGMRVTTPDSAHKNILVVDSFLPAFDRAAGSLRLFHVLKSLLKLGHRVTFFAINDDHAEHYAPILRNLGVEVHTGGPLMFKSSRLLLVKSRLKLKKILRGDAYDAVILCFWGVAEVYLPVVRRHSPPSTVIIDTVDIHFVREAREAELKKSDQLYERARRNKQREVAVYEKADRLWVVTPDEKGMIRTVVGDVPVDVLPTVHETVEADKTFEESSDLLFVGNFNHRPNQDAVHFFCEEVLPHIVETLPDVKLFVVGNNPPAGVRGLASDRVVVTGYVKDLSPYLRRARVSVSPLRYGAGMKGKIGEAMSWGVPVVTTSVGAEGMNLEHGKTVLIADHPQRFAAQVVTVYKDRELWGALSRCGKKKAEEQWSPEAVEDRLKSVFDGLRAEGRSVNRIN